MSRTERNAETEPDVQHLHEKDVVLTSYARGDYDNPREFIDDVLGDHTEVDLYDEYTTESRTVELKLQESVDVEVDGYESARDVDLQFDPYSKYTKEALVQIFKMHDMPSCFELVDETTESTDFTNSVKGAVEDAIGAFAPDERDVSAFDYTEPAYSAYVQSFEREVEDKSVDADDDDTITQYVRVSGEGGTSIEPRQVLTHQSERTRDNRFEAPDEYWSFQTTIHLEATSEAELAELSEAVVQPIYTELGRLSSIDAIRISECEEQVTRQGSCYAR